MRVQVWGGGKQSEISLSFSFCSTGNDPLWLDPTRRYKIMNFTQVGLPVRDRGPEGLWRETEDTSHSKST